MPFLTRQGVKSGFNSAKCARMSCMKRLYRVKTGREGEDFAVAELESKGWTICERNWRRKEGEIDIIALDGETLVFVEVKNWPSGQFDDLERVINAEKRQRMIQVAEMYIAENPEHSGRLVRFDVVFAGIKRGEKAGELIHIESAFTE